jgi:hypothetical protein
VTDLVQRLETTLENAMVEKQHWTHKFHYFCHLLFN